MQATAELSSAAHSKSSGLSSPASDIHCSQQHATHKGARTLPLPPSDARPGLLPSGLADKRSSLR